MSKRFDIPDHVLEESVGDEVIILSLKKEIFYSLNESGMMMWKMLKENGSTEDLAHALVERYQLDQAKASQDVANFVADLLALELLFEQQTA